MKPSFCLKKLISLMNEIYSLKKDSEKERATRIACELEHAENKEKLNTLKSSIELIKGKAKCLDSGF